MLCRWAIVITDWYVLHIASCDLPNATCRRCQQQHACGSGSQPAEPATCCQAAWTHGRSCRTPTHQVPSASRADLGRDEDDVDVRPEVDAVVLQHAQQEAVRQAQRAVGLHRRQDARIQVRLRSENNQKHSVHTAACLSSLHQGKCCRLEAGCCRVRLEIMLRGRGKRRVSPVCVHHCGQE